MDGATLRIFGQKQDPYLGKIIKARYKVLKKLGEGGMGTVYLGEQVSVGRNVALKLLQGNYAMDDEFIGRFRREARLAASLNHSNIVTIYDFDQSEDGSLFIAMEYLHGSKLSDIVRRDGPLGIARAVRFGLQIAEGLDAAHRAGVIHRDIKPDNIMVIGTDGLESIKLMDFGIARLRDAGATSRLTRPDVIMGTPSYMAPEQAEGADVSDKTDIYALGIVLYEMLSGSVPFKASTPSAVLLKQIQEAPLPLRKLRREIPASFERVVMQALEKKPEKRQRDMREVAQGLQKVGVAAIDEPAATGAGKTVILPKEEIVRPRLNFGAPMIGAAFSAIVISVVALLWLWGAFDSREADVKKLSSLTLQGKRELTVGDKAIFTAGGNYSVGTESKITRDLEWHSSDTSIVTVNSRGEIEARKDGFADIVAKHQGAASPPLTVVVKAKAPPPGPVVDDYIKTAQLARDKGDYDIALDALEKAKALEPKSKIVQAEYQQTKSACLAEKLFGLTKSRCN
jgi:predicted Ser/Thr protein kinase